MDKEFALKYDELEQQHWWFRARRNILKKLLNHYVNWQHIENAVEIGTSSGNNLYSLYPSNIQLFGVEPFAANVEIARQKGNIPVYEGKAESLPLPLANKHFDLITMFDVLEHTPDDIVVLNYLHKKLSTKGQLILTVPAYMWMWGQQDIVSHHYRRYTRKELTSKLKDANYKIAYSSYFNTILFPPIAAIRLLSKLTSDRENSNSEFGDFAYSTGLANTLLYHLFNTEKKLLPHIRLPFGVSVIIVATKN